MAQAPSLSPEAGFGAGGETAAFADRSAVGYIDDAIPTTRLRIRFDAAYDDNRPDRAEFFYAKCGCFPGAPGPPNPETRVDYQDISTYLEVAASNRFSGFIEVPWRFLNPEQNANVNGIADINAGVKYALLADPGQYVTLQVRTYIPTGDADRGLGTDHVSLEPGLLVYKRLTDQLTVEGEFKDWIPIGGTEFAGNIIRYGVGVSYDIYRTPSCYVAPIVELVGWTVLSGKEFALDIAAPNNTKDAAGDTIVNAKVGARVGFGERSDIYVGYGRALTGAVWYKDLIRAEYRISF